MNHKSLKVFFVILLLSLSMHSFAQSLSPERVSKIQNCTVRLLIDSTPIGTGFLINDKGFALTCWHVANLSLMRDNGGRIVGFRKMYMELNGGAKIEVGIANYFLMAGNKNAVAYDYCLIVPVTQQSITNPTPYFRLGSLDHAKEGQEIYTCGYPLGIPQQFISKGIISTIYTDKTNGIITNGQRDTLPRSQALLNLTMNRGNSGGAIIKLGNTVDEDEVIGIADFIINPVGGQSDELIGELEAASGIAKIGGIDPNKTLSKLVQFMSSTSIGVSGCVSINYSVSALAAAGC